MKYFMTISLLFILVLIFPTALFAYNCSREVGNVGPSHHWNKREVNMVVNDLGGDEVTAAETADAVEFSFLQWNQVQCSNFNLHYGGVITEGRAYFDWQKGAKNENLIVFRNKENHSSIDDWLHPVKALAITTATFVSSTGEIVDADIEINDNEKDGFVFSVCEPSEDCVVENDLKNTLVHEIGHVLGLDHPLPSQQGREITTMFGTAGLRDLNKRDLAEDDADGLCFIYPKDFAEAGECYPEFPREAPPSPYITEVENCQSSSAPTNLFVIGALLYLLSKIWRKNKIDATD